MRFLMASLVKVDLKGIRGYTFELSLSDGLITVFSVSNTPGTVPSPHSLPGLIPYWILNRKACSRHAASHASELKKERLMKRF